MGSVGGLFVSGRRWVNITVIAAVAIVVGSTLLLTAHRVGSGSVDLEVPAVDECAVAASC